MDDFVLNVRQIGNYPAAAAAGPNDLLLLQINGLGGAYSSISPQDLLTNLTTNIAGLTVNGSFLVTAPGAEVYSLTVNQQLTVEQSATIAANLNVTGNTGLVGTLAVEGAITQGSVPVALLDNVVISVNGRQGNVILQTSDILQAGAAPITNAHFNGWITAPSAWNPNLSDDTVATTHWVQQAICAWYSNAVLVDMVVSSFNGRGGAVVLNAQDITDALTVPSAYAFANTPPLGDASGRLSTTMFVDNSLADFKHTIENEFNSIIGTLGNTYAPINNPQFTGVPTAPTAAQTVNSGQLATTAFVHAAVTASTTGVASFNTRTGAVTLTTADITNAGGAPIVSPTFGGSPAGPTAPPGTATAVLATTQFVMTAIADIPVAVASFNTRTGAVTLTTADITAAGGAPIAGPVFSGIPIAVTASPGTSTGQLATTAFVTTAINALPVPVSSFNGRTGAVTFQASDISAVNGALLASPAFTGTPTAPTATAGTSNTQLATTAFVQAAVGGVVAGVSSYNGRTGAVVPIAADITAAGGALLAGPTFTGVPQAPTASAGTNSAQIATTAFVTAAIAASPGGVTSFNGRTGAITFQGSDISAAGGALLAGPSFTGTPTAPTATAGNSSTQLATTAFVTTAIATAGGVNSFNGRAGVVTLTSTDVFNAEGAIYQQSDTAPPTTQPQTLWFNSLNGQLYVEYVDPSTSAKSWVVANSPQAAQMPLVPMGPARVFTTSGTYTPTTGMRQALIRMVGGGGGGGGCSGTASMWFAGGGGGSGGYAEKLVTAAQVGASQTVTVGAAGTAGTGTSGGGSGGTSSVGSLCTATGGTGGGCANSGAAVPLGGPGGGGTGGDFIVAGGPGQGGSYNSTSAGAGSPGGAGGSSPLGGGGPGTMGAVGSNGMGYGGGGGGAGTNTSGAVYNGGAGIGGLVIITEYA
jgi:hypothetical protein